MIYPNQLMQNRINGMLWDNGKLLQNNIDTYEKIIHPILKFFRK